MEEDYCVLCQEAHKIRTSCLQDIQCKMCGKSGHLRIDCPGPGLDEKDFEKHGLNRKRSAKVSFFTSKVVKANSDSNNNEQVNEHDKTLINHDITALFPSSFF